MLSDLASRGCDLQELRGSTRAELTELLTALGFEPADAKAAELEGLLSRMPQDLSGEELTAWAAENEGKEVVEPPSNEVAVQGEASAPAARPFSSTRARCPHPASVTELLTKAEAKKSAGNERFKAGELGPATTAYTEAVELLTSTEGKALLRDWWEVHKETVGTVDTFSPLLLSLHTNLAACHNKLGQWESSVHAAGAALAIDTTSVKARFRRGVAHSNLGNFDEAKQDLLAVVRADPKNREVCVS